MPDETAPEAPDPITDPDEAFFQAIANHVKTALLDVCETLDPEHIPFRIMFATEFNGGEVKVMTQAMKAEPVSAIDVMPKPEIILPKGTRL